MLKIVLVLVSTVLSIYSLLETNKIKKSLDKFPDSFKKEYLKHLKPMTVIGLITAILILVSFLFVGRNFFYILILISMILSSHTLFSLYDEFENIGELGDKHEY